jgi:hypothetical protein
LLFFNLIFDILITLCVFFEYLIIRRVYNEHLA